VISALGLLLPLSLGGALSPVMLTEQTALLGTGGRRVANHYALGAVLTLLVIVILLVFFGHVIALPTEPKLSATLDIVLGLGLLALGCLIHYLGEHPLRRNRGKREIGDATETTRSLAGHPEAAFPFGVFSMATNFTTLALVVVAAKEIAAADVDTIERALLILVLVAICSVPAWAPLAATRIAPRTGRRALDGFRRLINDHGRAAVVGLSWVQACSSSGAGSSTSETGRVQVGSQRPLAPFDRATRPCRWGQSTLYETEGDRFESSRMPVQTRAD
jgi:Sap, sulfolipid-1-addressing protein